jgi:hypothetical protein
MKNWPENYFINAPRAFDEVFRPIFHSKREQEKK